MLIAIAEEIQGLQISLAVISEIVGDVHTQWSCWTLRYNLNCWELSKNFSLRSFQRLSKLTLEQQEGGVKGGGDKTKHQMGEARAQGVLQRSSLQEGWGC